MQVEMMNIFARKLGWDCATPSTFLVEAAWVEPVGLVQANTWLCLQTETRSFLTTKDAFASKNQYSVISVLDLYYHG